MGIHYSFHDARHIAILGSAWAYLLLLPACILRSGTFYCLICTIICFVFPGHKFDPELFTEYPRKQDSHSAYARYNTIPEHHTVAVLNYSKKARPKTASHHLFAFEKLKSIVSIFVNTRKALPGRQRREERYMRSNNDQGVYDLEAGICTDNVMIKVAFRISLPSLSQDLHYIT